MGLFFLWAGYFLASPCCFFSYLQYLIYLNCRLPEFFPELIVKRQNSDACSQILSTKDHKSQANRNPPGSGYAFERMPEGRVDPEMLGNKLETGILVTGRELAGIGGEFESVRVLTIKQEIKVGIQTTVKILKSGIQPR